MSRQARHRAANSRPRAAAPAIGMVTSWAIAAVVWVLHDPAQAQGCVESVQTPTHASGQPSLEPSSALSLQSALARAPCHPWVRQAQGRLQGARADQVIAGQRPNPSLTVGANSIPRNGVGSGRFMDKAFDHQIRLDQALERGDKRQLRMGVAQQQQRAAAADLQQAQAEARADIAAAFLELRAVQYATEALNRFTELHQQSRRLIERRVQAGDAPALDLARLDADGARLKADAAQVQVDLAASRARLTVALGLRGPLPPLAQDPIWPLSLTPWADKASGPEPGLQDLLDRHAEVRAAGARTEAAAQSLRLAQAQRSRDVVLGLQANRYPATPINPSGSGNTVSLTATVVLLTAHAFEGEIARAQADWALAQQREAQVREAITALIEQRLAERQAGKQRLLVAQQHLMPAATQLAHAAEAAYARGGSSMLEVLEARRALRGAERDLIDAQTQAAKAELLWRLLDFSAP